MGIKREYKEGEHASPFFFIRKYWFISLFFLVLGSLFFKIMMLRTAMQVETSGSAALIKVIEAIARSSTLIFNLLLLVFIFAVILKITAFLFMGNPYNRGNPKIRIEQYRLEKMIRNALIDTNVVNQKNNKYGFAVGKVWPNISDDRVTINMEVIGDTHEKLVDSQSLINASLIRKWENFIVRDIQESENGRMVTYLLEDSSISKKMTVNSLKDLMPTEPHLIKIMNDVVWDVSKAPGALITGSSGSGKTNYTKIIMLQILLSGADLRLADPKQSELINLASILGADRVSSNPQEIMEMMETIVEIMENRQDIISGYAMKNETMDCNFVDVGMKPSFLVIDEYAALISSFSDNKERKEFEALFKQVSMKGRSAGVIVILITQRPDAKILQGDIREQLSLKVLLGSSSEETRRMMFGSGHDYPRTNFDIGSGLVFLDGYRNVPSLIEVPNLDDISKESFTLFKRADYIGKENAKRRRRR